MSTCEGEEGGVQWDILKIVQGIGGKNFKPKISPGSIFKISDICPLSCGLLFPLKSRMHKIF